MMEKEEDAYVPQRSIGQMLSRVNVAYCALRKYVDLGVMPHEQADAYVASEFDLSVQERVLLAETHAHWLTGQPGPHRK